MISRSSPFNKSYPILIIGFKITKVFIELDIKETSQID